MEYNKRNIFLQKSCRKWSKETSSRRLYVFLKSFVWGKSKWSPALFQYISMALSLVYNKSKSRVLIQRYSPFWFFRKGSRTSFSAYFAYSFSRKMFFMLCSINWPNFIVLLSLLLEILSKLCIAIVCFLDYDVLT